MPEQPAAKASCFTLKLASPRGVAPPGATEAAVSATCTTPTATATGAKPVGEAASSTGTGKTVTEPNDQSSRKVGAESGDLVGGKPVDSGNNDDECAGSGGPADGAKATDGGGRNPAVGWQTPKPAPISAPMTRTRATSSGHGRPSVQPVDKKWSLKGDVRGCRCPDCVSILLQSGGTRPAEARAVLMPVDRKLLPPPPSVVSKSPTVRIGFAAGAMSVSSGVASSPRLVTHTADTAGVSGAAASKRPRLGLGTAKGAGPVGKKRSSQSNASNGPAISRLTETIPAPKRPPLPKTSRQDSSGGRNRGGGALRGRGGARGGGTAARREAGRENNNEGGGGGGASSASATALAADSDDGNEIGDATIKTSRQKRQVRVNRDSSSSEWISSNGSADGGENSSGMEMDGGDLSDGSYSASSSARSSSSGEDSSGWRAGSRSPAARRKNSCFGAKDREAGARTRVGAGASPAAVAEQALADAVKAETAAAWGKCVVDSPLGLPELDDEYTVGASGGGGDGFTRDRGESNKKRSSENTGKRGPLKKKRKSPSVSRKGRVTECPHAGRELYSRGQCKPCYMVGYWNRKHAEAGVPPRTPRSPTWGEKKKAKDARAGKTGRRVIYGEAASDAGAASSEDYRPGANGDYASSSDAALSPRAASSNGNALEDAEPRTPEASRYGNDDDTHGFRFSPDGSGSYGGNNGRKEKAEVSKANGEAMVTTPADKSKAKSREVGAADSMMTGAVHSTVGGDDHATPKKTNGEAAITSMDGKMVAISTAPEAAASEAKPTGSSTAPENRPTFASAPTPDGAASGSRKAIAKMDSDVTSKDADGHLESVNKVSTATAAVTTSTTTLAMPQKKVGTDKSKATTSATKPSSTTKSKLASKSPIHADTPALHSKPAASGAKQALGREVEAKVGVRAGASKIGEPKTPSAVKSTATDTSPFNISAAVDDATVADLTTPAASSAKGTIGGGEEGAARMGIKASGPQTDKSDARSGSKPACASTSAAKSVIVGRPKTLASSAKGAVGRGATTKAIGKTGAPKTPKQTVK